MIVSLVMIITQNAAYPFLVITFLYTYCWFIVYRIKYIALRGNADVNEIYQCS